MIRLSLQDVWINPGEYMVAVLLWYWNPVFDSFLLSMFNFCSIIQLVVLLIMIVWWSWYQSFLCCNGVKLLSSNGCLHNAFGRVLTLFWLSYLWVFLWRFLCFLYKLFCCICVVCELFLFPMVTSLQFGPRVFVPPPLYLIVGTRGSSFCMFSDLCRVSSNPKKRHLLVIEFT